MVCQRRNNGWYWVVPRSGSLPPKAEMFCPQKNATAVDPVVAHNSRFRQKLESQSLLLIHAQQSLGQVAIEKMVQNRHRMIQRYDSWG